MKSAGIPQVSVEFELRAELRAELDAVLLPGETPTEFVEAAVRSAVELRRMQAGFHAPCEDASAAYGRTAVSVSAEAVLARLEAKVAARVKQLRK